MAEFRPHADEIRQMGVTPYVIGSGTPEQARAFAAKMQTGDLKILSDRARNSYRAMHFKRTVMKTLFSPTALVRGIKIAFKYRQGKTQGDPWQLGGAAAIRSDGEIVWSYVGQDASDHPSIDALTAGARQAQA